MNAIRDVDEAICDADDLIVCKQFSLDRDLTLQSEDAGGLLFETLNNCRVRVKRSDDVALPAATEAGPTLRGMIWGTDPQAVPNRLVDRLTDQPDYVHTGGRVDCADPNSLAVRVQLTTKHDVDVQCTAMNT